MSGPQATPAIRRSILLRLIAVSRWTAILATIAIIGMAGYAAINPASTRNELLPVHSGLIGQPAGRPRAPHIGLVAGHWGGNDVGAICADGLTEETVNLGIARRAKAILVTQGYRVDLLQEFDPRLSGYIADAIVSIHADSCEYINEIATGFKVARSVASFTPEAEDRLVDCVIDEYAAATALSFHANSITPDMTSYHTFREVAGDTPAVIIETGFMYLDRSLLTEQSERVASGIATGIVCFVESS